MTRSRAPLSATARVLGYAGLLPQLIALLLIATRSDAALGVLLATAYATMILSFLGGVWWGIAVQHVEGQPSYAAIAVTPTLVALFLVFARLFGVSSGLTLAAIGIVLMLTLLIDRRLTDMGTTPAGWMQLRVPLSLGLGGLTILCGILAPSAVSLTYSN